MNLTSRTVISRSLQGVLVIFATYVFVWTVLFLLPGNPIRSRIDNPQNPIPEDQAAGILAYYGLDRPWYEQFTVSLGRVFQGDLGFSLSTGRRVTDLIAQGITETAALASLALLLTAIFAFGLAFTAVFAPWQTLRTLVRNLPVVSLSTPNFLVALVLLQVFAYNLGWFSSIRDEGFKSLILPAVTLAAGACAPVAQVLIQGLDRASDEPFVNVLRSSGYAPRSIIFGHIAKNGSIPAITLLGLTIGELLTGAVIVETVFNRTGLGFVTEQAVRSQDGPVVLAVVMLVAVIFTVVNILTDLTYPLLDPRTRVSPRTKTENTGLESASGLPTTDKTGSRS
ncbi:ABC transporter permease [Nesterenkonia jeotgali]|uniref:Peptide/nickel transport system permease protein n=1 Tax=Nesterenkonia jeotgali TaxID=317018 RepID=A0A839FX66_9MICC|nr:ABC transporter permease [Nesterenkonia jeotgali]MBA8922413.1 peptide/nickel transport system permease protein [Nesterenkonia jeotgali]